MKKAFSPQSTKNRIAFSVGLLLSLSVSFSSFAASLEESESCSEVSALRLDLEKRASRMQERGYAFEKKVLQTLGGSLSGIILISAQQDWGKAGEAKGIAKTAARESAESAITLEEIRKFRASLPNGIEGLAKERQDLLKLLSAATADYADAKKKGLAPSVIEKKWETYQSVGKRYAKMNTQYLNLIYEDRIESGIAQRLSDASSSTQKAAKLSRRSLLKLGTSLSLAAFTFAPEVFASGTRNSAADWAENPEKTLSLALTNPAPLCQALEKNSQATKDAVRRAHAWLEQRENEIAEQTAFLIATKSKILADGAQAEADQTRVARPQGSARLKTSAAN